MWAAWDSVVAAATNDEARVRAPSTELANEWEVPARGAIVAAKKPDRDRGVADPRLSSATPEGARPRGDEEDDSGGDRGIAMGGTGRVRVKVASGSRGSA